MNLQDKNFQYFVKNHDKIYDKYPDSFVVIEDEKVILSAPTFEDALNEALRRGLQPGRFLVQECTNGKDAYTQEFHSRVVFA